MKGRTLLMSVFVSVVVYFIFLWVITNSSLITPALSVKNQKKLPENHIRGMMIYITPLRASNKIRVQREDGMFLEAYCYGVDKTKHKGAIPCGKKGFQALEGKVGTLWYVEERRHPWFIDRRPKSLKRETSKLAVQIELDSGELYPFSIQREALIDKENTIHWYAEILFSIVHFGACFLVWSLIVNPVFIRFEKKNGHPI